MNKAGKRQGEIILSEENREQVRRRRRSEYTEPREELSAWGTTPAEETDGEQENGNRAEANPEKPEQKPTEERTPENRPDHAGNGDEAEPDQEMPVQAPDSRVPLQARQMSASPYGPAETGNTSGVRRPGTRPVVAVRRLPLRDPEGESAVQTGRMPIRKPGEEQSGESSRQETRLQVGYAPGRMSEREQAERPVPPQATSRIGDIPQNRVRIPARPLGGSPITAMSMQDRMPRKKKKHTLLWVVPALVLAVVLAVVLIPSLRKTVTGFAGKIFGSSSTPEPQEVSARSILLFKAEGGEGQTAPANVVLTVQADKTIQAIRASSGNNEGPAPYTQESSLIENDDSNLWTLSLHVTGGMNDVVRLEVSLDGENWLETEYSALVNVTAQTVTAETPAPGADQAIQAGVRNDGEDGGAAEDGLTGEEGMEDLSGDEAVPMGQDESDGDVTIVVDGDENPDSGENADSGDNTASGDESVPDGDEAAADATGEDPGDGTDKDASAAAVPAAPEATEQPEATEEPEPTPAPLTAEAGPGANPDLIALTTVYNGSKKVTNYVRPAKELIHMPSGWDYPYTQMGILTFRGNAFRTNAAVGHVESAEGLK